MRLVLTLGDALHQPVGLGWDDMSLRLETMGPLQRGLLGAAQIYIACTTPGMEAVSQLLSQFHILLSAPCIAIVATLQRLDVHAYNCSSHCTQLIGGK